MVMPQDMRPLTNKPSLGGGNRGEIEAEENADRQPKLSFSWIRTPRMGRWTSSACGQDTRRKLDISSSPNIDTVGLLGSARSISNATVHFRLLAYICKIRTSGFLFGFLIYSLGPSHLLCSFTHKIAVQKQRAWGDDTPR